MSRQAVSPCAAPELSVAKTISLIDFSDGVTVLSEYSPSRKDRGLSRRVLAPLPPEGDLPELALEAVNQAALSGLDTRNTALCLGADQCLLRDFALPLTARAKVAQAVDFELANGLPLPASELHGTTFVSHPDKRSTRIFSFSLRRETFAAMLRGVRESGHEPRFVGVDLACAAQGAATLPAAPGRRLLMEIGFSRTLAVTIEQGTVHHLHRAQIGCDTVLDSGHEAREALLAGPLQADPDRLRELAATLAREVVRGELLGSGAPAEVILCGPGAGLRGLAEILTEALGVAVHALGDVLDNGHPAAHAGLVAAGLLRHMDGGWLPTGDEGNLRQGEFAFVDRSGTMLRNGLWAAGLAALLITGWAAADLATGVADARSAEAARQRAGAVFTRTLPEVDGDFGQTQMVSILRSRIDQMSGQTGESEQPAMGALDILRHVSQQAKNRGIVVDSLSLGPERGHIAGTSKDYAGVNGLRDELAAGGTLGDVRIVMASASKAGQDIRFDIQFARK